MPKYINAGDLQAQLGRKKAGIANQRYTEGWNDCMMRVKSMVSKAPAVDAEAVTRCKNCYYSVVIKDILYCTFWSKNTDENGYCHEGG